MSNPRPQEVAIHVLGGPGSGRATFIRRYMYHKYDPYYDLLGNELAWTCKRTFAGGPVRLQLDNDAPSMYRHVGDEIREGRSTVQIPDAVIIIINPVRPAAIDEAFKSRLDHLEKLIRPEDGIFERVVIVKDIGMSWRPKAHKVGFDPNERVEVPLNLTPEEREVQEQEWLDGAERGYELARRLKVEATIACSRTGEGVEEVVDGLVTKVLKKRRVDEAKKAEEERRREEARLLAAMPRWKQVLWKAKSWKEQEKL